MKRPLALLVAAVAIALVGSACSSTLTDAATIKYSQQGKSHTVTVTRDDLLSEALARISLRAGREAGVVITIGDYVGKGPDSKAVIDRLLMGAK